MTSPLAREQDNFTDPDSRITKTGTVEQSVNEQTAMDAQVQIIVAGEFVDYGTDFPQLPAMRAAVQRNTAQVPGVVLADAGAITAKLSWYHSVSNPAR